MTPWDALPDHIDEPDEWDGKDDDDHFYTKWRKKVKGWFAYSYRSQHWWACWKKYPVAFLCFGGKGKWRYESPLREDLYLDHWDHDIDDYYLSRIQYQKRWNVIFQWPLFIAIHIYLKEDAMPKYGERKCKEGLKNQINFYTGAMIDGDLVYWFPSVFLGGTWK